MAHNDDDNGTTELLCILNIQHVHYSITHACMHDFVYQSLICISLWAEAAQSFSNTIIMECWYTCTFSASHHHACMQECDPEACSRPQCMHC